MTNNLHIQDVKSFRDCCHKVFGSSKTDGYAKAYAEAGLTMTDDDEIKTQCLYIISNIALWRGDEASAVRAELKRISKVK